jgi:hypothetical protein
MTTCKNCEAAYAVASGYCLGCLEDEEIEKIMNGITCRYCDNLVKREGNTCVECAEAIAEEYYDAIREEEKCNEI